MKMYLIGSEFDGYCKIGKSEYSELRAQALDRPKLPFPIKVLAEFDAQGEADRVEKELHAYFEHKTARGEWFTYIRPEIFLRKAEQFTGPNPKPGRTEFPLTRKGGIGFEKWVEQMEKDWKLKSAEEKEQIYKGLDALELERKTLKAERIRNARQARKHTAQPVS
jgi:hypothetical protein